MLIYKWIYDPQVKPKSLPFDYMSWRDASHVFQTIDDNQAFRSRLNILKVLIPLDVALETIFLENDSSMKNFLPSFFFLFYYYSSQKYGQRRTREATNNIRVW